MHFSICGLLALPVIHVALLVKEVMEEHIFKRCAEENLCFYCYRSAYVNVYCCAIAICPRHCVSDWVCVFLEELQARTHLLHQAFISPLTPKKNSDKRPKAQQGPLQLSTSSTSPCVWRTWDKGARLTSLDEHLVPLLGICNYISFHLILDLVY